MMKMQCRKMPNWNDPGKDDVQILVKKSYIITPTYNSAAKSHP